MLSCIDVKFIFDSVRFQLHKYCRPPSCLLAVFAMFLVIISPSSSCSSYSWNELNVRHFFFHNQNNSTLSPGLLGNGALTCRRLHFWRHFLVKHKILPHLVVSNWLWRITRVLLEFGKYIEWIITSVKGPTPPQSVMLSDQVAVSENK